MLYLGEPDYYDTEKAAQLLVRYRRAGGLSPEAMHMFWMMCSSRTDVRDRAAQIEAEEAAKTAESQPEK